MRTGQQVRVGQPIHSPSHLQGSCTKPLCCDSPATLEGSHHSQAATPAPPPAEPAPPCRPRHPRRSLSDGSGCSTSWRRPQEASALLHDSLCGLGSVGSLALAVMPSGNPAFGRRVGGFPECTARRRQLPAWSPTALRPGRDCVSALEPRAQRSATALPLATSRAWTPGPLNSQAVDSGDPSGTQATHRAEAEQAQPSGIRHESRPPRGKGDGTTRARDTQGGTTPMWEQQAKRRRGAKGRRSGARPTFHVKRPRPTAAPQRGGDRARCPRSTSRRRRDPSGARARPCAPSRSSRRAPPAGPS